MRRSSFTILAALAVAIGLATTGVVSHRREAAHWQTVEEQTAALEAEIAQRDDLRPVLYGDPIPDTAAWPLYRDLLLAVAEYPSIEEGVRPYQLKQRTIEEQRERVEPHAELLARLRAATHAERVGENFDFTAPYVGSPLNLLMARGLANLCVAQARLHALDGEHREAVECLLDGAQMGRDLMHSPLMVHSLIGQATLAICTFEPDLFAELPDEALAFWAEGLATLDRSIEPTEQSLLGEALLLAKALLRLRSEGTLSAAEGSLWQTLDQNGRSLPEALLDHMDSARSLLVASHESWARCADHHDAVVRVSDAGELVRSAQTMQLAGVRNRWTVLAQVRLLRMALAHRLGEPVTALPDPFGGSLQFQCEDEEFRFWSEGDGAQRIELFR